MKNINAVTHVQVSEQYLATFLTHSMVSSYKREVRDTCVYLARRKIVLKMPWRHEVLLCTTLILQSIPESLSVASMLEWLTSSTCVPLYAALLIARRYVHCLLVVVGKLRYQVM